MTRVRDSVLLFLGIAAVLVALIYMPRYADIPQFSYTCIRQWIPVMVFVAALGGGAIFLGVRNLLRERKGEG